MTVEKPQLRGRRGALRARQGHLRASDPSKRGFFDSHIIAILAAILFPVFAKAREKARQSSCLSNCKQIMLGVLQYAQDYDETLPGRRKGSGTATVPNNWTCGAGWQLWSALVYPYVKNAQVFVCPSNSTGVGYGYNPCNGDADASVVTLGAFTSPSTTVKIGDSWSWGLKGGNPAQACSWTNSTNPDVAPVSPVCGGFASRHNSGGNLGFLDGHVKWMSFSAVKGAQGIRWAP